MFDNNTPFAFDRPDFSLVVDEREFHRYVSIPEVVHEFQSSLEGCDIAITVRGKTLVEGSANGHYFVAYQSMRGLLILIRLDDGWKLLCSDDFWLRKPKYDFTICTNTSIATCFEWFLYELMDLRVWCEGDRYVRTEAVEYLQELHRDSVRLGLGITEEKEKAGAEHDGPREFEQTHSDWSRQPELTRS